MVGMKCPNCGWTGSEEEMLEKETELEPNDHSYQIIYYLGVTRKVLQCPKCGKGLRTYRYIYGSRQEGKDV
jgi:predicted RNA-binding Zn-ribbon protein involved in translation (DUF1610 family)